MEEMIQEFTQKLSIAMVQLKYNFRRCRSGEEKMLRLMKVSSKLLMELRDGNRGLRSQDN